MLDGRVLKGLGQPFKVDVVVGHVEADKAKELHDMYSVAPQMDSTPKG
jgi:hypothetical protein